MSAGGGPTPSESGFSQKTQESVVQESVVLERRELFYRVRPDELEEIESYGRQSSRFFSAAWVSISFGLGLVTTWAVGEDISSRGEKFLLVAVPIALIIGVVFLFVGHRFGSTAKSMRQIIEESHRR